MKNHTFCFIRLLREIQNNDGSSKILKKLFNLICIVKNNAYTK